MEIATNQGGRLNEMRDDKFFRITLMRRET